MKSEYAWWTAGKYGEIEVAAVPKSWGLGVEVSRNTPMGVHFFAQILCFRLHAYLRT